MDKEIRGDAREWFDSLFVRTGIQECVWHYFIPAEIERQGSTGSDDVGRDNRFPFTADRLRVLWCSIYQMLRRSLLIIA